MVSAKVVASHRIILPPPVRNEEKSTDQKREMREKEFKFKGIMALV